MRIRITLIAKEKLISLSITAFKSTGSVPPSGDLFHSTCSISALAKPITGGIPAALRRANPRTASSQRGQPELQGPSGIAIGGIFAPHVGISHFAFLDSALNKTQEANTYQVLASN